MNDIPQIIPRVFKLPDGRYKVSVRCGWSSLEEICDANAIIGTKEKLCAEMAEMVGYGEDEEE